MPRKKQQEKKEPRVGYMISAIAERYDLHPQTLRMYERHGLITPSRSDGNTRLYTEEDCKRLEVVIHMTRDLGVNLAGVEVVLNMREKMERLQSQVEEFVEFMNAEMERMRDQNMQQRFRNALVRVGPRPKTPTQEQQREDKL